MFALIMIVTLVGCGGRKRQPIELTLNTEDAAAILAAAGIRLPDASEAKGANSVVEWFCWYDPFQNYDEGEMVNTGYFTFTQKYGGLSGKKQRPCKPHSFKRFARPLSCGRL